MKISFQACAVAAASLLSWGLLFAGAPATHDGVSAPAVPKVGDVTEYAGKYFSVACKRWEVKAVDNDVTTRECGDNLAYSSTATGNLMRIASKGGDNLVEFKPQSQMLQFPLTVGKTWKSSYEGRTAEDGVSWTAETTCTVKGTEKAKVAAGEFDTLRIECQDAWKSGVFTGTANTVNWYAPKAGAVVKSTNADVDKWNYEAASVATK
jgi:hypothetical protein